jgi:hypothetical protein
VQPNILCSPIPSRITAVSIFLPSRTASRASAIGSIRRECLNHVIVLSEVHLKRILASYLEYYHGSRPHWSLDGNSPTPREAEPPSQGEVVSIPQVGGLHHRYTRAA